jgi:hypothetical protein
MIFCAVAVLIPRCWGGGGGGGGGRDESARGGGGRSKTVCAGCWPIDVGGIPLGGYGLCCWYGELCADPG